MPGNPNGAQPPEWPQWLRDMLNRNQPLDKRAVQFLRDQYLTYLRYTGRITVAEWYYFKAHVNVGQPVSGGIVGELRALRQPRPETTYGVQPPAPTPGSGVTVPSEASQIIRQALEGWGLGSEAGWAYKKLTEGASLTEILAEVKDRPAYRRLYGEVHELRRNAGLPPLTEAQIMQERARYRAKLRQYGHDTSRYDDARDFNSLFAQDIDADEFGDRLELDYIVRNEAGPKLRALYEQRLGVKLEDKDVYELLSGQRPDLTPKEALDKQYEEGAPRAFKFNPAMPIRDLLKSFKQAQQERAADFLGDGSSFVLDEQTFA